MEHTHKDFFNVETAREYVEKLQKGKLSPSGERRLFSYFEREFDFYIQSQDGKNNHLYDQEDMKSEFLINAWTTLYKAKMDVGNPLMFALSRAKFSMIDYYRKINSEKLILFCPECDTEYTYDRRNTHCKNPRCCGTELMSREKEMTTISGIDLVADTRSSSKQIDGIVFDDIMQEIIEHICMISELASFEREMAISAIESRSTFYNEAKAQGKSHSWSMTFEKKIQKYLQPVKDRYFVAVPA